MTITAAPVYSAENPYRILIIGPSWVGDMVMAQSLFISLKQQYSAVEIDVLAPAWSRPILERMPEVRQAIDMPLGHGRFGLSERRALGHRLRGRYEQSIVLPNSWKSALIPWFANIPRRTGWKGEARYLLLNDLRKLDKQALPLMVQRFVRLAYDANKMMNAADMAIEQCPAPALIANHSMIPALLEKFSLRHRLQQSTERPTLILCPGAEFGPAKQWPATHYGTVATTMIAQGWQVWVMGSPGDKMIAEDICQAVSNNVVDKQGCLSESHTHIYNLCGLTTLEEAIDLLSCADYVVSNDSGLMHIASALNTPVIALYGATSPAFTPPLSGGADTLFIPVDCGPCFQRECPKGHHRCMQELSPNTVVATIRRHDRQSPQDWVATS